MPLSKMIYDFNDFKNIIESKQTEKQALKVLGYSKDADNKNGIDNVDKLLQDFKDIDKSKNQILLPSIAYFYKHNVDLQSLNQVFSKIPKLLDRKILSIQLTKKGVQIKNDIFTDWLKFSEKIDAIYSAIIYKEKQKTNKDKEHKSFETETDEPIFDDNGIKIYDGKDVGSCIRLGKGQSFCISQPDNTMYQSYRDSKSSSFYFIYDDNQKDNPLKIVVFDNTQYGVELTDETNDTGTIYKYGNETEPYIEYLKTKGVPVDTLLLNKPKTEDEIKEFKLLSEQNLDLKWFIDLTPDYKTKYIGRGHRLSFGQWDYLFDNNMWDLLNQYINIGHTINYTQFAQIETKPNLLKSYIRFQYQLLDHPDNENYDSDSKYVKYFDKFGYLEGDKKYENGESDSYYKVLLYPTIEGIEKYDIDLEMATNSGYLEVVKTLLDNGADATDDGDNTFLLNACEEGHAEIVKLLIDNGSDVSHNDHQPIKDASHYGKIEVVKVLLDNGADATDGGDNIAIDWADSRSHIEIVELLKRHGAVLESVLVKNWKQFNS
jgi:hypothetical protein